jgi:tRNA pseudouridine38-40 synthase
VPALCNLAVFDTESRIPPEKFANALNVRLPEQICVQNSREVPLDFHPRFCDTTKTYRYQIWNRRIPNPLVSRYSTYYYYALDEKKMNQAAQYLVGEHDFVSFCSVHTQAESTVRTIYSIDVIEEKREGPDEDSGEKTAGGGNDGTATGSNYIIRICGNGFLYNMVRIIAGSLAETGSGKQSPEWMEEVLKSRDRTKGGPTAPPQGLLLKQIVYDA